MTFPGSVWALVTCRQAKDAVTDSPLAHPANWAVYRWENIRCKSFILAFGPHELVTGDFPVATTTDSSPTALLQSHLPVDSKIRPVICPL